MPPPPPSGDPQIIGKSAFKPAEITYPDPNAVVVSNAFNMVLAKGPRLWDMPYGIWTRPDGALMLNCPDGDGQGMNCACTHWVGVIYSLDREGRLDLCQPPMRTLLSVLFSDLSRALFFSELNQPNNILPRWDVFRLSGCQNRNR